MENNIIYKGLCILFVILIFLLGGYTIYKNKDVRTTPLVPTNNITDTSIKINKSIKTSNYSGEVYIKIEGKYNNQDIYTEFLDFNTPDSIICKHLQAADSATKRAKYIQEEFKCL